MKYLLLAVFMFSISTISAQVRNLEVEPNHSTIGFRISIAGFTEVTGKFGDYKINIDWNDEDYAASTIASEINVKSINTGIPDRDTHLQSADFFDVATFPTITFKSDSIRKVNFSNFEVYGKFTMHGVTKNIMLPFQIIKMKGNTIGFRSRNILNRIDYGVGSEFKHTSMPDFLAKKIQIELDFWTRKRKDKK